MPLLAVSDLRVRFGEIEILRGVSFEVQAGQTLGIVGESGCGKSMTGLSVMGMVPRPGQVSGSINLDGRELVGASERDWQQIRGQEVAMVMQDPFSSLNPVMRVGDQIAEVLQLHQGASRAEARKAAIEMLDRVGIPDPAASAQKFAHQMSGGQRQRVVIAIAFIANPKVLVADEPTTALDVTLQAQVLRLLKDLQKQNNTGVLLISHDIGVIATESDQIAVFYAGQVVETGPTVDVLKNPQHPYTQSLLRALPTVGRDRLEHIEGQPPRFNEMPVGCAFGPRCREKGVECDHPPQLVDSVRCWKRQK